MIISFFATNKTMKLCQKNVIVSEEFQITRIMAMYIYEPLTIVMTKLSESNQLPRYPTVAKVCTEEMHVRKYTLKGNFHYSRQCAQTKNNGEKEKHLKQGGNESTSQGSWLSYNT